MAKNKDHLLNIIIECEGRGDFHYNVDTIDQEGYYPVDENYPYLSRNVFEKIYILCFRFLLIIIMFFVNSFTFSLKVKGRKNLKGIKNAIVISNHVHYLDNLIVRQSVLGRPLYIVVGEFNNRKGPLGKIFRASGTLPLSTNQRAMINFTKATRKLLTSGNYVLMYPEEAEWHYYQKPRPYKDGAFHLAVTNKVPIIPLFITFENKKRGTKQKAIAHILKPIYQNEKLSVKENINFLKTNSFQAAKDKYEEFYKKELVYETESS